MNGGADLATAQNLAKDWLVAAANGASETLVWTRIDHYLNAAANAGEVYMRLSCLVTLLARRCAAALPPSHEWRLAVLDSGMGPCTVLAGRLVVAFANHREDLAVDLLTGFVHAAATANADVAGEMAGVCEEITTIFRALSSSN